MATIGGKKKSEMDVSEINRYWASYFASVDTQTAAQSKLQELEDGTNDLGEKSGYRADRLRLDANVELLRAKRIAFNAETAAVNPPSDALVKQIQDLAAQVAAETATRNRASAIVKGATDAMTKFAAIQSKA